MTSSQKNRNLLQSVENHKLAHAAAVVDYLNEGYAVETTGVGHDFRAFKNKNEGVLEEFVEVKSGNGQLTKVQKKTKQNLRSIGKIYTVYRVSEKRLDYLKDEKKKF